MEENIISAVFDSQNREWTINHEGVHSDSCVVSIKISTNDDSVDYTKITYGYKFYVDGDLIDRNEYPKIRAKIDHISENYEVLPSIFLEREKSNKLNVWMRIEDDIYEKEVTLENLRPRQPYESWTYVDGEWQAPIPRPVDGITTWDEEKQEWINLDHQYMPGTAGSLIKE